MLGKGGGGERGRLTDVFLGVEAVEGYCSDDAACAGTVEWLEVSMVYDEERDSQDPEAETNGHQELLLALHVEVPDDEPGENCEAKVRHDEPS